jgi:hypothetical protein
MTTTPRTPQPLTADQLAEIQARAEAATPGPWNVENDYCDCSEYGCSHPPFPVAFGPFTSFENTTDRHHYDADFAAHARTDVPALIAEVARLKQAAADALAQVRQVKALDTYSANRLDLAARILTGEEVAS